MKRFRIFGRHRNDPRSAEAANANVPEGASFGLSEDRRRTSLHGDTPIATDDEDRLGRRGFAARLARQIELAPQSGLVIALVGPWGSGKTSVLRMVERRLRETDAGGDAPTVVVNFNPWLVSGSEQLVSQFFVELSETLPRQLGPDRAAKAANRLRRYSEGLRTLEGVPGVGWAFQLTSALMEGVGDRIDTSPTSLQAERAETEAALAELDVRIVVLIDDVDRLQRDEVRHLMRMIKLVGDFPNVVYLLAFDREPVRKALTEDGIDGIEYLEKIVQIEYRLPQPPPEKLEELLVSEINAAIREIPEDRFDIFRWNAVYQKIVLPLVTRPRHVRRFTNALPLALELAGEEVDAVDVVALTAVQTLLPGVDDALPGLRDDLIPGVSQMVLLRRDDGKERTKERLEAVISSSEEPEVTRALFDLLFPDTAVALSNTYLDDSDRASWRRSRRIADREAFDTYMTASLPAGALAVADVREVVVAFSQPSELDRLLHARPPSDIPSLLDRVWAHLDEIPIESVEAAIEVLQEQEARLRSAESGIWSPADRVRSFVLLLVQRVPAGPERDALIRRRYEANPLSERLLWIRDVSHRDPAGHVYASSELLEALRADLARTVLETSAHDLMREARPGWLVRHALDATASREKVAELVREPTLFHALLATFLALGTGARMYHLQLNELQAAFGDDYLRDKARGAASEPHPTDEAEREALAQLLEHYRDEVAAKIVTKETRRKPEQAAEDDG